MKVAIILLSTLALATPSRRYPSYGGGGGGFNGGFGGGSGGSIGGVGGGAPIVFPGKVHGGGGGGGIGGGGAGHIHDQGHSHGGGAGVGVGVGVGGAIGGIGGVGAGVGVGVGVGGSFPSPIGHDESVPLYLGACSSFNSPIHHSFGGINYHYSWCADGGQRYTWQEAYNYCAGLGQGWTPVNIETPAENTYIVGIVGRHRSPWIWTGGNRLNNEKFIWEWSNGLPVTYTNWGQTGFSGAPQPDNSENNNERCLSLLNQFYPGDLITWHDIGCHHRKPTICEYSAGGVSGGLTGGVHGGVTGGVHGGGVSGGGVHGGGVHGGVSGGVHGGGVPGGGVHGGVSGGVHGGGVPGGRPQYG